MVFTFSFKQILLILALFLLCDFKGFCQDGFPKTALSTDNVELAEIETALADVAADSGLSDTLRTSLIDLYQQAKQQLQTESTSRENTVTFESLAGGVAERLVDAKAELEQPKTAGPAVNSSASVESIQQDLANAQSKLESLTTTAKELSTEPARRQKRLAEIPPKVAELEKELDQVREQQTQSAPASESAPQTRARTTLLHARGQSISTQLEELEKEQAAYLTTRDLLPLRVELASRRVETMRATVEQLQAAFAKSQIGKVEESLNTLQEELEKAPRELKALAQSNLDLAKRQQILVGESAIATRRLDEVQKAFKNLKSTASTSHERIEVVGLTEALGLTLRNKKSKYEQERLDFSPQAGLRGSIEKNQLESFGLEDELSEVENQIADSKNDAEIALLRTRKNLLDGLYQTQNGLLQTMVTTDTQSYELRNAIDDYINFIDEHIFWIRSSPAINFDEVKHLPVGIRWLFSPRNWTEVIGHLFAGISSSPAKALLGFLVIGVLMGNRRRLRRIIREAGVTASHLGAKFRFTVTSFFATIFYAAAWPSIFGFLGWLLKASGGDEAFVDGVADACFAATIFVATRCLMLEVCRKEGLAVSHLGWGAEIRELLRKQLNWFIVVGGTLLFLMVVLDTHPDENVRVTCLRLASILLFILSTIFHHLIFRASSPVYGHLHKKNADSKIFRWRKLIWLIICGLPVSFAVLAVMGYLDTAFHLAHLYQSTSLLGVSVVLTVGLMLRWLTLNQQSVRLRQAKEARAKSPAATGKSKVGLTPENIGIEIKASQKPDLPALDKQTRQLIYMLATAVSVFGLFFIWSDLLPVIEIFEKVKFWSVTVGGNVEVVTLRDVLYIAVTIFVFAFAARNLPSLMELLILRRTPLDSGARYALTTILRYILTVTAVIVVLNLLSVSWTGLGWMLTAASVGLGFGLQEIVANFVSGIILLLERPVRVGDVVTIDGTTGVVSRIQMRATTVTSWDRKELVVPNKDLITEKLLNWSLSNVINRLTIEVQVGYDSDPDEVLQVLRQVLAGHSEVMKDPEPRINFESFGESALVFTVRYYLDNLDHRISVTHEVNTAIIKALREANIKIPFPHRELTVSVESKDDLFQR